MSQRARRRSRRDGQPGQHQQGQVPSRRQHWLVHGIAILEWTWLIVIYGSVVLGMGFLGATLRPYHLAEDKYLPPTVIYASDGVVLAKLADHYRTPVTLREVPRHTVLAMLAAEDARFYHHRGLDWHGIVRAAWVNLRAGHITQGGSTITQQLVRIELLSNRRTLMRKLREAIYAIRIERAYTKNEILERYLNAVYFGGGAYGLGAAAKSYFGKPVSALTPAESALLAGLIRAPGEGNPRFNPEIARRRQHAVLAAMVKYGWLSSDEYQAAMHEPIVIRPRTPNPWRAPYVVDAVRLQLLDRYGRKTVYQGGFTVYTTINSRMQREAERALRHAVQAGRGQRVGNGALVAIEPQTGYIRAMVGGTSFDDSQFNRAMYAHRQPGSAFKAFVYQAALEQGHLLSDLTLDAPITIGNWSPQNYGQRYYGVVTLQEALARSMNSVSVRLTKEVSPYAVIVAARQAGITSPLKPNLTIALGSSEVTPLEMARAYGTFGNGGVSADPTLIAEIRYQQATIYREVSTPRQRMNPATAFFLTQGLRSVITSGTGRRAHIGRPAAGKTGTSSDYRDAWFVGYTPYLSTAVWLGNDNRRPMAGVAGGTLPAQAWAEFMRAATRGMPATDFAPPANIIATRVCRESGLLALPTCPATQVMYFPLGRVPTADCPLHYWVTKKVCAVTGQLANPTCPATLKQFAYNDLIPRTTCPVNHRVPPGEDDRRVTPFLDLDEPAPTPVPIVRPPVVAPVPPSTSQEPTPPVPGPAVAPPAAEESPASPEEIDGPAVVPDTPRQQRTIPSWLSSWLRRLWPW